MDLSCLILRDLMLYSDKMCFYLLIVCSVYEFIINVLMCFSSSEHKCSWWAIGVCGCPSPVNIWCLHSRDHICDTIFMRRGSNVCFDNIQGQVRIWVMKGQKLGYQVKSSEILVYTLEATFAIWFWWNLVRMFILTISRLSSNIGHVWSKTRSPGQIIENSC